MGRDDNRPLEIDKKGQLCLKYRKWGSGFLTCYSIVYMDDSYKLFRVDGGLDTSFTVLSPGESTTQAMAAAPSYTPTRTAAPKEEKKSWLGSLWPWGKEEQTLTPAIKSDTDVFMAPAPVIEKP